MKRGQRQDFGKSPPKRRQVELYRRPHRSGQQGEARMSTWQPPEESVRKRGGQSEEAFPEGAGGGAGMGGR